MRRNQLRKVCIQRARSSSRRGCTPPSAVHSFRTMNKWNRPQKNILQVHTANFMIELLWWDEILIRLQHVGWLDYCVPIAHGGCGELGWGKGGGCVTLLCLSVFLNFQFLMTNEMGFFLTENNSSTWSQNRNHDRSVFTERKTFHALGAFCDLFYPPSTPVFSLSLLCVRKSSLPRGLSVIMLMGNKEIILNGTLISSALPLPSA